MPATPAKERREMFTEIDRREKDDQENLFRDALLAVSPEWVDGGWRGLKVTRENGEVHPKDPRVTWAYWVTSLGGGSDWCQSLCEHIGVTKQERFAYNSPAAVAQAWGQNWRSQEFEAMRIRVGIPDYPTKDEFQEARVEESRRLKEEGVKIIGVPPRDLLAYCFTTRMMRVGYGAWNVSGGDETAFFAAIDAIADEEAAAQLATASFVVGQR